MRKIGGEPLVNSLSCRNRSIVARRAGTSVNPDNNRSVEKKMEVIKSEKAWIVELRTGDVNLGNSLTVRTRRGVVRSEKRIRSSSEMRVRRSNRATVEESEKDEGGRQVGKRV